VIFVKLLALIIIINILGHDQQLIIDTGKSATDRAMQCFSNNVQRYCLMSDSKLRQNKNTCADDLFLLTLQTPNFKTYPNVIIAIFGLNSVPVQLDLCFKNLGD